MRIPLLRCVNLHVTNFRLWGVTFRFLPYSIPTKLLLLNIFWLIYYFIWIGIMYSKVKSESESCSVMSNSLPPHGLYSPWNSPGQNTGVGCPALLQGVFPAQGSNRGLPHCRQIWATTETQSICIYTILLSIKKKKRWNYRLALLQQTFMKIFSTFFF